MEALDFLTRLRGVIKPVALVLCKIGNISNLLKMAAPSSARVFVLLQN